MGRFPERSVLWRGPRPADHAASDGIDPGSTYSATVTRNPSGGLVNVVLPGFDPDQMFTAFVNRALTLVVGDKVLVVFDDAKTPWVVAAQ